MGCAVRMQAPPGRVLVPWMIHPSAIIDPDASLAEGVSVGPFSIIGPGVSVGAGTSIGAHVVVQGRTRIGAGNNIHSFCSIGEAPQDKKYAGEDSRLEIGHGNVIREFCTLNRGTAGGGGRTRIGDDNWVMAYVHVAHDCAVGSHTVMANATTLAGHVTVDDYASFGALTVVHQFCRVGAHAFSAMGSVLLKDVPPFVTVSGNFAVPHGLNIEGLRRRGFEPAVIRALRGAYKTIYKRGLALEQALDELSGSAVEVPEIASLRDFILGSRRGIVR